MYQVLARKWRPKVFSEVIGQEHILRALTNALEQQRLHHAYLFTGTRGVGKTTIARILAKCFNCKSGVTATPCCTCDNCKEIDSGRFIDLIEVDAASRTKVEDTRELLDNVQYLPAAGRYKIYLIDEVHMLSNHSFNALLKTLEEPPAHVKFLLATTDPQKLPVTILSRCLQFNLKKLPPDYIQTQLGKILTQEKVSFEDKALLHVAVAADGSVRDALSLLDQAIAYGGGKVNTADVCAMLGNIENTYIFRLLEGLANKNANHLLEVIAELSSSAADFADVINELLITLHDITIAQLAPDSVNNLFGDKEQVQKFAPRFAPDEIQLYYQIGLIGKRDISLAPNPKSGFEMLMLRMLAFRPGSLSCCTKAEKPEPKTTLSEASSATAAATTITSNNVHNEKREPRVKITETAAPPQNQTQKSGPDKNLDPKKDADNSHMSDNPVSNNETKVDHNDIIAKLKVSGPTAILLKHSMIAKIENSYVELLVAPTQAPLLNKSAHERISVAFSEFFGKPMKVEITIGSPNIQTPAKVEQQKLTQRQEIAQRLLESDPNIQKIMSTFDANIVEHSIVVAS